SPVTLRPARELQSGLRSRHSEQTSSALSGAGDLTMTRQPGRLGRLSLIVLLILAGGGTAAWYAVARGKPVSGGEPAPGEGSKPVRAVAVEVVSPRPGGIDRVCVQPGTVEPFEAADLYAKVSGY